MKSTVEPIVGIPKDTLRHKEAGFEEKLDHLRSQYEPYAVAIALNLSITLPPWIDPERQKDNWQAGPWDRAIQARGLAGRVQSMDDHF